MMKMHKIAMLDSSPIVIGGLSSMLKDLPEYELVLSSTDPHTMLSRIHMMNPEVLIVNPLILDYNKRMSVRTLFADMPHLKMVALVTGFVETQQLRQYHGIIELNDDVQRVKSTLNAVCAAPKKEIDETDSAQLSDREKDVLVELAKGLKNNEIADKLNISVHTVVTHRKNIVRKTAIKSVAALTVYAILNNLIDEKDII